MVYPVHVQRWRARGTSVLVCSPYENGTQKAHREGSGTGRLHEDVSWTLALMACSSVCSSSCSYCSRTHRYTQTSKDSRMHHTRYCILSCIPIDGSLSLTFTNYSSCWPGLARSLDVMSIPVSVALFYTMTNTLLWDLPGAVLAAPASALRGWQGAKTLSHSLTRAHTHTVTHTHEHNLLQRRTHTTQPACKRGL